MTLQLFAREASFILAPGAVVLPGYALPVVTELLAAITTVTTQAPWRHMPTVGGHRMSVAMSNCGALGWTSDRSGYRYLPLDPGSGLPWPALPESFLHLAQHAAVQAGFDQFLPDACLMNRYAAGTKLSLHQDQDECDFTQPIVSVSLGLPATFLFGGFARGDRPQRVLLEHGDVVVWGGPARLRYHGVAELAPGQHPLTGPYRFNLTLRRAG